MHIQFALPILEIEIAADRYNTTIDGAVKWRGEWRCFEWSPMVDCPLECWVRDSYEVYDPCCPICGGEDYVYPHKVWLWQMAQWADRLWFPIGLWINAPASDYSIKMMNAAIEHDMKRNEIPHD